MTNEALWEQGVGEPGLKFFHGFLEGQDSLEVFDHVNNEFPWNVKPKLYGTSIPQHSYLYKRPKQGTSSKKLNSAGLAALEELCVRISNDFECHVESVYCNRFADPNHKIDWHQDQYASHIFVLSLGGRRGLEFRHNKTKEITRYDPQSGDLYFMSLQHNKKYHHRVLSGIESGDDTGSTRISFVFFVSAPFNKKEYQVGWREKLYGGFNAMLS